MSADLQTYPIHCTNCDSDNTDCSSNFGSEYAEGIYSWDEVWKCRDCGSRFQVARQFDREDFREKLLELLDELGVEADVEDAADLIESWADSRELH